MFDLEESKRICEELSKHNGNALSLLRRVALKEYLFHVIEQYPEAIAEIEHQLKTEAQQEAVIDRITTENSCHIAEVERLTAALEHIKTYSGIYRPIQLSDDLAYVSEMASEALKRDGDDN